LERIRFLTSHPNWMTDELLEGVAALPKVCEHIEVPIQAGDDAILAAMRRGYTVDDYRRLVARVREKIPGVGLATDGDGDRLAAVDETGAFVSPLLLLPLLALYLHRQRGRRVPARDRGGGPMRRTIASVLLVTASVGAHAASKDIEVRFDDNGLASIRHNGAEVLDPSKRIRTYYVTVSGKKARWSIKPSKRSFDAASRTLTEEYDEFRLACTFEPGSRRLDITLSLTNKVNVPIEKCPVEILTLAVPHTPANVKAWKGHSFGRRLFTHAKGVVITEGDSWRCDSIFSPPRNLPKNVRMTCRAM